MDLFIIILIRFDDGKTDPCPSLEATMGDSNLFGETEFWPAQCSKIIPPAGGVDTERVYFDGKQRSYDATHEIGSLFAIEIYPLSIDPTSGRDDLAALRGPELSRPVFGFTEEIAVPHGGFEGWTRICFTVVEADEDDATHRPSIMRPPGTMTAS
jgi:hypothetical protein